MTPASLLVVKPSSLGDIVHTLPAVHYLKTTFPQADISWVANAEWVPILEENADLKSIIPFPRRQFRGALGLVKFARWSHGLSSLRPDLVLDFQGLLRSAWISRNAQGQSVYGLSDAREGSRFFYNRSALVSPGQHSVDRYLALARLAGANTSGPVRFPLPAGKAISSFALPDRFVVLHPFARGTRKSLTSEEISALTHLLDPIPVIVVGQSKTSFSIGRNAISLINQTNLPELIWLLRKSRFVISVDSGPMHIAAAITPELLSIHLWSDPSSVGPYNPEAWIWKAGNIFQAQSNQLVDPVEGHDKRPDLPQIASFVCERWLH